MNRDEEKRRQRLTVEINAYKRALAGVKNSTLRIWIESQIASREAFL